MRMALRWMTRRSRSRASPGRRSKRSAQAGPSNYLVGWWSGFSNPQLQFARVSLAGSMLDPGDITVPGVDTGITMSARSSVLGGNFFTSWLTYSPGLGAPHDLERIAN